MLSFTDVRFTPSPGAPGAETVTFLSLGSSQAWLSNWVSQSHALIEPCLLVRMGVWGPQERGAVGLQRGQEAVAQGWRNSWCTGALLQVSWAEQGWGSKGEASVNSSPGKLAAGRPAVAMTGHCRPFPRPSWAAVIWGTGKGQP